jgi:hypothetical protein
MLSRYPYAKLQYGPPPDAMVADVSIYQIYVTLADSKGRDLRRRNLQKGASSCGVSRMVALGAILRCREATAALGNASCFLLPKRRFRELAGDLSL